MLLPNRLRELVGTARFWSDYLGDEVFGEQVAGMPDDPYLELPLSPHYSLRIGYFWRSTGEDFIEATDLRLREVASGKEITLGWSKDDGHAHPHALRWEEADLIGRLEAIRDPEMPHPGIPFLLLLPYVASIEGSDDHLGLRLLNTALRSLGVFNERQIRYRLSAFRRVPAVSEWQRIEPYGWVCQFLGKYSFEGGGRTIHSLRRVPPEPPSNWPGFPFDVWNHCMRHAARAVAEGPHRQHSNAGFEAIPPSAERIELCYQLTKCDEAYSTLPLLRHALFEEGLGVCYISGSWTAFENLENPVADMNHPNAGEQYEVKCYGDLPEIVELIRRIVKTAGHPEVRLYQKMQDGAFPPFRRITI